jgi:hypothetical protein
MDFEFHPNHPVLHSAIVYQSLSDWRPFAVNPAFPEAILPVTMPLPRPGHFAEREELDAALQHGTAEALREFIERHADSRYRAEAESALRKLVAPSPSTR